MSHLLENLHLVQYIQMQVSPNLHLTYCTNVHSGDSWDEVQLSLEKHTLEIKKQFSPDKPMGVGLRLSHHAANGLLKADTLVNFKEWLSENNLYVFTLNGFPFSSFHGVSLKDRVHEPDWRSKDRLEYTKRLIAILSRLLPTQMTGGISTSPISYKYWFDDPQKREAIVETACLHLAELAYTMSRLYDSNGKILHIDIEPEPDGFIETIGEWIYFYENQLLRIGRAYLEKNYGLRSRQAEETLRKHIQLCYDICHFAVTYETPAYVLDELTKADIMVGKIQVSAALKAEIPDSIEERQSLKKELRSFEEPTYLHQAVIKDQHEQLIRFRDLGPAIESLDHPDYKEIRTHFHVPVFLQKYGLLQSTQSDIVAVMNRLKEKPFTAHLEVETYTWDVLPDVLKTDINSSIVRELEWVRSHFLGGVIS